MSPEASPEEISRFKGARVANAEAMPRSRFGPLLLIFSSLFHDIPLGSSLENRPDRLWPDRSASRRDPGRFAPSGAGRPRGRPARQVRRARGKARRAVLRGSPPDAAGGGAGPGGGLRSVGGSLRTGSRPLARRRRQRARREADGADPFRRRFDDRAVRA